jgi:tetratricopeptide (TPR) repeat protein
MIIRGVTVGSGDRKVTLIGHGGGINGFNTALERIIEDRHLIVLLNNSGGTRLTEMAGKIRSILYDQTYTEPTPSISREIYRTFKMSGVEAAVRQYRELKEKQSDAYEFAPPELDRLGRHLLQQKKHREALEFLKLNAEVYASNPNAHASLGDAYRESGNKELAVKSYARALELNPNNRNLVDKIKETQEKK